MLTIPSIEKGLLDVKVCEFVFEYTADTHPTLNSLRTQVFANIPAATDTLPDSLPAWRIREYKRGWAAVRHTLDRHWFLADAIVIVEKGHNQVLVFGHTNLPCDAIAIGIDPRMTREDIEGATHIFKNKKDTGWLFAHATEEEHHDRILLAETAISVVFEELLMDRLIRMDVIDIAGRSTSNRRGELTILAHINSFRNDCMKMARYNEGQLHIGQHVKNPEEHYIYKMVEKAFALAKKKWKAEKPAELNQISDRIAGIEKRLKSRHTFKRRWEIPTVFPNAERQTPTESSGE